MPFDSATVPSDTVRPEAAILDRMAELLTQSWGKGCDGGNCIILTLAKIINPQDRLWCPVMDALRWGLPAKCYGGIVNFNDAPETTLADVLGVVARARRTFEVAP